MAGLITTIVVAVAIAFFTGFNLDNRCNVNLLFHTFQNVPVFVTILISFVAGIVIALPFSFSKGKKVAARKIEKIKAKTEQAVRDKIHTEKNDESPDSAEEKQSDADSSGSDTKKK